MLGGMSFRWLTIFLDFPAGSFDAGVTFWREVTGYGLSSARGADGEFATLLPPSGDAYLRVQRIRDGAGGCHLDLHVDTRAESLDAAAGRAVAAGAVIRHREDGLVVAESPGGFPFCLVEWDGERDVPPPLSAAGDAGGASRVDTLCLDVVPDEFDRELAFWAELTGQESHPAPVPGYAYLTPAGGLAGPPAAAAARQRRPWRPDARARGLRLHGRRRAGQARRARRARCRYPAVLDRADRPRRPRVLPGHPGPLLSGRVLSRWPRPRRALAVTAPYRWTLPEISVCVPPPIQIAPSASAVTWTRPRRPSTVPWLAV